MPTFGLAKHRPDQPVEQIDGLVGQVDAEVQADGDQRCMSALAFVTGDVLHRRPVGLARELRQARLVDQMTATWLDADRANMLQALDQAEHGGWRGRFWHLAQPGQPVLSAFLTALGQRIEALALFGGQAISKPAMYFLPGTMTDIDAEPFECRRPWQDDPTLPALLHDQFSQMAKPLIFDSARQEPGCQLSGRPRSERTQPQPVLQLGRVAPAVPLGRQIVVNRLWKNVDLFGNKSKEWLRWPFVGPQRTTGIPQVAKHERLTEAVVIATAAVDCGEVSIR